MICRSGETKLKVQPKTEHFLEVRKLESKFLRIRNQLIKLEKENEIPVSITTRGLFLK